MSIKTGSKISIVGAGAVGAMTAFTISLQQLCTDLVLIDINTEKARGEALDINHGLPFLGQMNVRAGDYSEIKDSDLIIITAGIPRKHGESRLDLAKKNVGLAKIITKNIMEHYNGGTILVISNPCDVITYMVTKWSGLPPKSVVGSGTVLDSARFRFFLSEKLNVDVRNVHGYIIGEHGDSQIPAWSNTNISGISIDNYTKAVGVSFTQADKMEIAERTRYAGAEVIKLKGLTCNGIAVSAATITKSLIKGENTVRTVGCVLDGQYGIKDIVTNVPMILGHGGIQTILEVSLDPQELRYLQDSAEKVRQILNEVKDL